MIEIFKENLLKKVKKSGNFTVQVFNPFFPSRLQLASWHSGKVVASEAEVPGFGSAFGHILCCFTFRLQNTFAGPFMGKLSV